eukprot:1158956-Pelagomonas_calceolata.AAC.1
MSVLMQGCAQFQPASAMLVAHSCHCHPYLQQWHPHKHVRSAHPAADTAGWGFVASLARGSLGSSSWRSCREEVGDREGVRCLCKGGRSNANCDEACAPGAKGTFLGLASFVRQGPRHA